MTTQERISNWLLNYATKAEKTGFVVGVSGGIDSAVTSTLCALTGLRTDCVLMPIQQNPQHTDRGFKHIEWLMKQAPGKAFLITLPLGTVYDSLVWILPKVNDLALANAKARLRMTALYALACSNNLLVAGTGNKVEDYGCGFFTKYGDGGVDISPIGSLTKTEVWQLGRELGINQEIIDAIPTDGLWSDDRADETQIGCSYPELEWAMDWLDQYPATLHELIVTMMNQGLFSTQLNAEKQRIINIYWAFHARNAHKNALPPIC